MSTFFQALMAIYGFTIVVLLALIWWTLSTYLSRISEGIYTLMAAFKQTELRNR